jgi:hypothetical protein
VRFLDGPFKWASNLFSSSLIKGHRGVWCNMLLDTFAYAGHIFCAAFNNFFFFVNFVCSFISLYNQVVSDSARPSYYMRTNSSWCGQSMLRTPVVGDFKYNIHVAIQNSLLRAPITWTISDICDPIETSRTEPSQGTASEPAEPRQSTPTM